MMPVFFKIREFVEKRSDLDLLLFIVVLTFLCYVNIFLGHEFITYDDDWYIYKNKNVITLSWESIIASFTSIQKGQYSPIAEVYHAVLYFFFKNNAIAFKFFALLNHLLNVVLVFKLFRYLSSNRWLVIFVSLVFAIHPLQVETIGWLSVIYRIAVFFMLLGYLFYCKYLESNYNWRYLALVILFFIMALFTKEQAILFPIGLVLINLKRGSYLFEKRIIYENILFGIMAVIFAFITVEITKTGGPSIIERQTSFLGNMALLSETIIAYSYNFLFPVNLSFTYPYPLIFAPTPITYFRFFIALCIIVLAIIVCYRHKQYRFGILWILGFLSIAFSFSFYHLRESFMADRYIYFAIIGFAYTLFLVLKRTPILQVLGSLFIVMLIVMTINRVPVFKSSYTLFKDAIKKNSKNHFAYGSLGFYYRNKGEFTKAIDSYEKSLELCPNNARVHSNLGKVYFEQKKYDLTLTHVNKAIQLDPNYERGYKNRIAVNQVLKNDTLVLKDLNFLLNKRPGDLDLKLVRAKTYFKLKDYKQCIADCDEIIGSNKATNYVHYMKGHSLFLLNKNKEAVLALSKAIKLNDNVNLYYYIRSLSYFKLNNYQLAYNDALAAKEHGYKVPKNYLTLLTKIPKK